MGIAPPLADPAAWPSLLVQVTASPTTTFEARGREVWALNAWNDEADTVGPLDFCYFTVSEQAYDPERYARDIASLLGGGDALRAKVDRLQSQLEAGPPMPTNQVERIATAAMKGMLAHPRRSQPRPGGPENWHDALAKEAKEIAAAMIRTGFST